MPVHIARPRRYSSPALAALSLGAAILGSVAGWLSIHRWPTSHTTTPHNSSATSARNLATDDSTTSSFPETPSVAPAAPWADRWEETITRASTPARTRALTALLEELARTDPQHALTLAQNQPDWRLREILRDASLRGWASVSPDAAGNWALGVRIEDRRAVVGAVLQGAATDPDATVRLALRLCAADTEPAGDYGHAAIAALVNAGAFSQAADFGSAMGSEKYAFLLKSAYFEWARQRPAEALAAANKIADPQLAAQARAQAITGWSWADAAGLANHALKLPPGPERSQALAEALPLWLERYPEEAATWIQKNDTGSEFDSGLAALANQQSFLKTSPDAALNLAADISDPARRTETMRSVFQQWAARDPLAARAYIDRSSNAADRVTLSAILADVLPNGTP
jgi:hypothetical protein